MTNKEKFELIDISKLPSEQKSIVEKTRTATNNFTVTDERINTAIGKGLDTIIAKLRDKNPEALKDFKAPEPTPPAPEPKQPKAKKTPVKKTGTKKAKAVTTTPEPSKPKNGLMIKAKEIRKEGETWEQAVKRASEILKGDKTKSNEVVKTEMQKLLALVRRRKELKGITGTNIPRDAKRTALPRGKRISKDGNTYYESRDNRTDRLAPNYPKNLPLLADGGLVISNDTDLEEVAKYMTTAVKKHKWDLKDLIYYFEKANNFDYKYRVKIWDEMDGYEMPKTYENILKLLKKIVEANDKKMAFGGDLYERGKNYPVKTMSVADGEKHGLDEFPNFSKTGSISGMKKLYYGKDALLIKSGNYIYNVSSKPELYFNNAYEDGGSILMNSMYKKGGLLSPVERYKEELKGLTGLSKTAINDFIVDYNITESELLNIVIGLGRKQITRADVVTAIVGDKGNSYMADVLAFAKSNTALKAEEGIDLTDDNRLRVQPPAMPKRKLSKQELADKFNAGAFEFMTNDDEDDLAKAELGANLAGWNGTRFGIGTPQTDLDGFTGTDYSGLVGETGAMSSGELFEGGGDTNERLYNFLVDDLNKLETAVSDNDTEQIEIFFSYWLGSSGHLNSLKPKTNERLYNFLVDDLNKLETAIADKNTEQIEVFFSYWLGDDGHLKSLKMADGGFMAKGGMIVYLDGEKSKSFKTKKSLYEFVRNQTNTGVKKVEIDYGNRIIPTFDTYLIEDNKLVHKGELIQKNYNKEDAENRRLETERNINKMMGFANGGQVDSSIIDELWNGYATAILFTEVDMDTDEPLENEYSISDFDEETVRSSKMMLSNFYIKNKDAIEESELDLDTIGNDIWYTQSGQGAGFFDHSLDDDIEKKLISGAKAFGESPSVENYDGKISVRLGRVMNDYAEGGAINGSLNKKIQKLAQSKGLTFDKLGKDEYNLVMTQALVESLTDANFHEEAKEVVAKAEKKEWSDELYKSVYFNPEEKIGSFAREVARDCEWDGDDIINAYFFLTKMEGSKVAGMIEELFLQSKPKNPNDFTPTVKFEMGDIVWDKGNESYGTVMNVYGDPIEGASGEIRLDSDGNQSIFTFDKDWNISGYNLNKLGSKGDEGSFYKIVLDEMKASANRLIASRKESKDKDGVAYYQEVYKRLLDGEFDSMVIEDGAPKKYIKHDDIKSITVMYKGKQTTFKAEDVLNGANLLADGGELQKKAFYIAKRDVVSVELKSGETVKPVNGYWIKKDVKPLSTPSAPSTNKEEMPFEDWLTKNNISVYKRTYYWVADDGGKDYMYSGTKAEVMKSLKEDWKQKKSFAEGSSVNKMKIKDWYIKNYPTDDLGEEISDASFEDLWNALHQKEDVYDIIGVGDSLVRERLFEHLSEIKGVEYNDIYNKWLEADEYAKGGSIPNNYEGNTAEEVWEKWSARQRLHFLEDHFLSNSEYKQSDINQIYETKYYDWNDLPHLAQQEIKRHVSKGQYKSGGDIETIPSIQSTNHKND